MKKLLTLTAVLALAAPAFANNGGFQGANQTFKITSVAQALKANDDARVALTGKITKQLKHDEFLFADKSGEIKIEVEDEAWQGQTVTEKDTITIFGKVDKEDWGKREIEVHRIQKH